MRDIKLRSVKVRRIMEEKPSIILRYGTIWIILLFVILLTIIMCQPFPHGNGETIFQYILRNHRT